MKLAIIGSRTLKESDISRFIPAGVTEIVSGGAKGVDAQGAAYAREHGIPLTEFLPDYARYGRGAPHRRNRQIAAYAEAALVFWDGRSRGTQHTVALFRAQGKQVTLIKQEE